MDSPYNRNVLRYLTNISETLTHSYIFVYESKKCAVHVEFREEGNGRVALKKGFKKQIHVYLYGGI